jgi:hypothetical protein
MIFRDCKEKIMTTKIWQHRFLKIWVRWQEVHNLFWEHLYSVKDGKWPTNVKLFLSLESDDWKHAYFYITFVHCDSSLNKEQDCVIIFQN